MSQMTFSDYEYSCHKKKTKQIGYCSDVDFRSFSILEHTLFTVVVDTSSISAIFVWLIPRSCKSITISIWFWVIRPPPLLCIALKNKKVKNILCIDFIWIQYLNLITKWCYDPIFTLKIKFILKLNSWKSETIFDCRIFVALAK